MHLNIDIYRKIIIPILINVCLTELSNMDVYFTLIIICHYPHLLIVISLLHFILSFYLFLWNGQHTANSLFVQIIKDTLLQCLVVRTSVLITWNLCFWVNFWRPREPLWKKGTRGGRGKQRWGEEKRGERTERKRKMRLDCKELCG